MIPQKQYQTTAGDAMGAAARRKCQSILEEVLWPLTELALNEVDLSRITTAVDFSCGRGGTVVQLMRLLDADARLYAFSSDDVNIEYVTERLNGTSQDRFVLINKFFEESEEPIQADLVIGRSILNDIERLEAIIAKAASMLTDCGYLVVEIPDFSMGHSFPRSYALDRYCEYLGTYQASLQQPSHAGKLRSIFAEAGLESITVSSWIPCFLDEQNRRFPSLILEYISSVVAGEGQSHIELQTIISELRRLADQPGAMITAPGGFRVVARSPVRKTQDH